MVGNSVLQELKITANTAIEMIMNFFAGIRIKTVGKYTQTR